MSRRAPEKTPPHLPETSHARHRCPVSARPPRSGRFATCRCHRRVANLPPRRPLFQDHRCRRTERPWRAVVELRTVHGLRQYTGQATASSSPSDEPGLIGQNVFFRVSSHGYEFPRTASASAAARVNLSPGGTATLKIHRLNIAEPLSRHRRGIYPDSVRSSANPPLTRPQRPRPRLRHVVNALYRGKMYWFWGDTNRPGYPLGNYHVPGAVSALPHKGGLDPEKGIDLKYFLDDKGFAKPTRMPAPGRRGSTASWPCPTARRARPVRRLRQDQAAADRLRARPRRVRRRGETNQEGGGVCRGRPGLAARPSVPLQGRRCGVCLLRRSLSADAPCRPRSPASALPITRRLPV